MSDHQGLHEAIKSDSVQDRQEIQDRKNPLRRQEEYLEKMNEEIKGKRRLLFGMQKQLRPVDKQVQAEIYNRDKFITELNQRLLEFKGEALEGKLRRVKVIDDQLQNLVKENNTLIQAQETLKNKIAEKDLEMQNLRMDQPEENTFTEEERASLMGDLMHTQLSLDSKNKEVDDIRGDTRQLGQIVAQLTKINADLSEKITTSNTQVESFNTERFQFETRVSSMQEVETKLAEHIEQVSQLQRTVSKQNTQITRLNEMKESLVACYNENAPRLKELAAKLSEAESQEHKVQAEAVTTINELGEEATIINELGEEVKNIKSPVEEVISMKVLGEEVTSIRHEFKMKFEALPTDDAQQVESTLRDPAELLAEQQATNVNKDLELAKIKTAEELLKKRIQSLENKWDSHREELQESDARARQRTDLIQEYVDKLKDQLKDKNEEIIGMQVQLKKADGFVENGEQKVRSAQKFAKTLKGQVTELQKELRLQNKKMNTVVAQIKKKSNEFHLRERRFEKLAHILKQYEEELYTRDTKVILAQGQLAQLKQEIAIQKHANEPAPLGQSASNRNLRISKGQVLLDEEPTARQHRPSRLAPINSGELTSSQHNWENIGQEPEIPRSESPIPRDDSSSVERSLRRNAESMPKLKTLTKDKETRDARRSQNKSLASMASIPRLETSGPVDSPDYKESVEL